MNNWNELMPSMVNPSRSTPMNSAPRKPPMIVPEPPASAVPPMTAAEIAKLLTELELDRSDEGRGFVRLRQNRGSLLRRTSGTIDILARGRLDWGGWVELKVEPVSELSAQHIAEVIEEVNADIVGVVEVESRRP